MDSESVASKNNLTVAMDTFVMSGVADAQIPHGPQVEIDTERGMTTRKCGIQTMVESVPNTKKRVAPGHPTTEEVSNERAIDLVSRWQRYSTPDFALVDRVRVFGKGPNDVPRERCPASEAIIVHFDCVRETMRSW